nr:MAG TPA: hypothetical protein [Caudoviricetes sp.]
MAITVIVLNWLDLACTLLALRGGGVELNPLMRSVVTMVWYKIAIVPLLVLALAWQGTKEARRALGICAIVYGAVCVWHAVGLWMITG